MELEIDPENGKVLLTQEQKTAIDKRLKNIEAGRTFTYDVVRKMTDKWLQSR